MADSSPAPPVWVTSPGKGKFETLEEWSAADHEEHVAKVREELRKNPPKNQPAEAEGGAEEGVPPEGDGKLTKAQRKMLEMHYERENGGVKWQMLWKNEFKVRDTLRGAARSLGEDALLAGRDTVLAGDPKRAIPFGDDPMHREG